MVRVKDIRREAAMVNWTKSRELEIFVIAAIQEAAGAGLTQVFIDRNASPIEQWEHAKTALELEGFYVSWNHEGKTILHVNWKPRTPR